jgi:diguanylate cyclase (GGDEF)-like protein
VSILISTGEHSRVLTLLDMPTVFIVVALVHGVSAGWLLLVFLMNQRMHGIWLWSLSRASFCLGILVVALEPQQPAVWLPVLGYVLVYAGFGFDFLGLCRYFEQPPKGWPAVLAVVVAGALTQGWYMSVDPQPGFRLALSFAAQSILPLFCMIPLIRCPSRPMRMPAMVLAAHFFAWSVLSIGRFGVLAFSHFDFDAVREFQTLALFLSVGIVISGCLGQIWLVVMRLQHELFRLARVDPLTGVANRRALDDHVGREEQRARRLDRPYAVICFDLDRFKLLNDNYGHSAGDAALVATAGIAAAALRGTDFLARVGGEEFTIILPDTADGAALAVAERIRLALAAEPISTAAGAVRVTASFGVAWLGTHGDHWTALRDAADQALYSAKQRGRNRVEVAERPSPTVTALPA